MRSFENEKDRKKVRVEFRKDGKANKKIDNADEVFVYGSDGRIIFSGSVDDWDDMLEVI